MYLKSLEIHGFKSFADKTLFEFDQGVTAVVGPNGCGKSNVVDAIRWVLGEASAKALRGSEMADVIFKGTEGDSYHKKRAASGMAQVVMTLGDCEEVLKVDYNEVSVTRKMFRDGKSEYRVNGVQCRLRDVYELFMDTGIGRTSYSIMEQGKIDMLLSAKPEDRRLVFEEAAGITKFKKEKKEALRKLDDTERNLERISDVLAEQERQMQLMDTQVHSARNYRAIQKDVRILDLHAQWNAFQAFRKQKCSLDDELRLLNNGESGLKVEGVKLEAEVSGLRKNCAELEKLLAQQLDDFSQLNNGRSQLKSRLVMNKERLIDWETTAGRHEIELKQVRAGIEEQKTRIESFINGIADLSEQILRQEHVLTETVEALAEVQTRGQGLEKSQNLVRSQKVIVEREFASNIAKQEARASQQASDVERRAEVEEQIRLAETKQKKYQKEREEYDSRLKECREHLANSLAVVSGAERVFQHSQGDYDSVSSSLEEAQERLAKLSSKLEVLSEFVESGKCSSNGTQAILSGVEGVDQSSVLGLLGLGVEVEDRYAIALNAVIDTELQAVLVSSDNVVDDILVAVREGLLGDITVVSKSSIRTDSTSQTQFIPNGALAWAVDCFKAPKPQLYLIRELLTNILVVKDLITARVINKELKGVTFVTLSGEVMSPLGLISGGTGEDASLSLIENQLQIKRIASEVNEQSLVVEKLLSQRGELQKTMQLQQRKVEEAKEILQSKRIEESNIVGQISLADREVQTSELELASLVREVKQIEERSIEQSKEEAGLALLIKEGENSILELDGNLLATAGKMEKNRLLENESLNLRSQYDTKLAVFQESLRAKEVQKSSMLLSLSEMKGSLDRTQAELVELKEKTAQLVDENTRLTQSLGGNEKRLKSLNEEVEKNRAKKAKLLQLVVDKELALRRSQNDLSKLREKYASRDLAKVKLELRIDSVANSCKERYSLDLGGFEMDRGKLLLSLQRGGMFVRMSSVGEEVSSEQGDEREESSPMDYHSILLDPKDDGAPLDWKAVDVVLQQLRQSLNQMGEVNTDSIEQYEAMEERFRGEKEQRDDLVKGKRELVSLIETINGETKQMFSTTFRAIQEKFTRIFQVLFGPDSEASLLLVNEGDPLECGIDIIAKPSGKKLQNISLLSGGERSMIAVALMFSIYEIKPSPFCVLDELDAPLDESNIGRFLRMLDHFIDHSQFIIVTHSKRTMQRSNVIYGVTMEERGVSRKVSMQLSSTGDKRIDDDHSVSQEPE